MSTVLAAAPETGTPLAPPSPRAFHRFSVAQYHRMIELGILTANDRAELIHGWIVKKMTLNPPHNASIIRITRLLLPLLPREWLLQVQGAVTLRDSEPEPDFAVIRGPLEQYDRR